jgi:hypothetical protein
MSNAKILELPLQIVLNKSFFQGGDTHLCFDERIAQASNGCLIEAD